jgi:hypothetical protein
MMGGGAAKPEWTEHTAPDGRKYFYNARTKQSSWEKPDELKTPQVGGRGKHPVFPGGYCSTPCCHGLYEGLVRLKGGQP